MNKELLTKIPQAERVNFAAKLQEVSKKIGAKPDELLCIMNLESGLNPKAVNSTSKAVGLIQFMPPTLKWLGYSFDQVYAMTATQQLDVVAKYFKAFQKPKSFVDLYLTIFYPAAVGKSSGYTFGKTTSEQKVIGKQNPIFNKGNPITVAHVQQYLKNKYMGMEIDVRWSRSTSLIAAVILAFIGFTIFLGE